MYLSIQNYDKGKYSLSSTFLPSTPTKHYDGQPIPNKWLQGDIVNEETKAIQPRDPKAHKTIGGIIDFVNRTRVGLSPKGVPLYNFYPYDPAYPMMVVSSKLKYTHNTSAIVALEHWNDKYPRAGIQYIHGPVGDKTAELTTIKDSLVTPRTVNPNTKYTPSLTQHDETPWEVVFNIDPPGCEDVDDVMGWRTMPLGIEFFIGIVDIAAWIEEHSQTDLEAARAAQTFYVDGVPTIPMFPHDFSTKIASLRADGVKRPILALVFTVDDYKVIKKEWRLINTVVTKAFTYDTVLADIVITGTLSALLTIVTEQTITAYPHVWVEQAMILYNTEAAKILKEHKQGILRRHKGVSSKEYEQIAKKANLPELAYLSASAGEYVHASSEETHHAGLNTDTYCHATSPLRRYADVMNHRVMRHHLFGTAQPCMFFNVEYLNQRAKTIKKYERLMLFLSNLSNDGSITTTDGIVLKYDHSEKKAKVYIPTWKHTITAGHITTTSYESGEKVLIRAFADLKATSIKKRIIATMSVAV